MDNFNLKLDNSIREFFSEIYYNFSAYDYALICDNGEGRIVLLENTYYSTDIAQFIVEVYGCLVYVFETNKNYYILIFNSSNNKNFRLELLNISNLYQNAEISFKKNNKELGYGLLFHKFSSQKFISFRKVLKINPASSRGKGFWKRESLINKIETKLNSHRLHYWWFEISTFESLSVSRFKHNHQFFWGMIYHDHYNYDLSTGIPVLIFDTSPKFVKEKAEEYVSLLKENNIRVTNVGVNILEEKWSGYTLYKSQSSFFRESYLKKIKRDEFGVYYKK